MSDKLSERMTVACTAYCSLFAPEVAALEHQLAAKDAEIARLQEAANKLAWACEVQITTTNNSRAFRNQHKEKCRYWIAQMRAALAETPAAPIRPKIVCLCGSIRFYEHFQSANYEQTMAGNIVLSVGFYPHAQKEIHHSEDVGCTAEQKIALDALHKRKIDLADEVFVLNVGGYIGSSTRSEIDYAIEHGKPVRYLETPAAPLTALALPEDDVPDAAPEVK